MKQRNKKRQENELYLKERNHLRLDAKINESDIFLATKLYNKPNKSTNKKKKTNNNSISLHDTIDNQNRINITEANGASMQDVPFDETGRNIALGIAHEQITLSIAGDANVSKNERCLKKNKSKSQVKVLLFKAQNKTKSMQNNNHRDDSINVNQHKGALKNNMHNDDDIHNTLFIIQSSNHSITNTQFTFHPIKKQMSIENKK